GWQSGGVPTLTPLPRRAAAVLAAGILALGACSGRDTAAAGAPDGGGIAATATTAPDEAPDEAPPVAEGYPAQPGGVPFPTDEWPERELPADVVAALDALVEANFAAGDEDGTGEVASIVVVQGGEIVYERYNPAFDADTVQPSWSMAKTFTAALVGLAVEDGLLRVEDDHLREEWPDDDPRAEITIEDLLHMASGLEW